MTDAGRIRRVRPWAKAAAITVISIALIVLLGGWGAGVEPLIRVLPALAAMVPSTAICFALLGGALASPTASGHKFYRPAGAIVTAIALADLIVILSGRANGIDTLFMPELAARSHDAMSGSTAICFALASASMWLLARRERVPAAAIVVLATLGLLMAIVALLGHIFDTEALYQVFIFRSMALHTSLLMVLLFVGIMLSVEAGWIWPLIGTGIGSVGARRLLPAVVAGPLIFCFIALHATRAGYWSAEFRIALLATTMIVIGMAAILWNARVQNVSEIEQRAMLQEVQIASADKDLLIREIHHRVKNNLQQISALITILTGKTESPQARENFEELSDHVHALGLVHQLLVESDHPSQVDIASFLGQLKQHIVRSHGLLRRNIEVEISAEHEFVSLDVSLSTGLLMIELVVNAIKHGFAADEVGRIRVTYQTVAFDPLQRELAVSDNGGSASDIRAMMSRDESGSMRILRSLVTQLCGKMEVEVSDGTTIVVRFPLRAVQNRPAMESFPVRSRAAN